MILGINSIHTNDAELVWKGGSAVRNLSNHRIDHVMFVYLKLVRFAGRLHVKLIVRPIIITTQIIGVARPMFDVLCGQGVPYSSVT